MRKGFTLIELIVVVIVIGILATFAIPQYLRATERARGAKANVALGLIANGLKQYRSENNTYVGATLALINTNFVELGAAATGTDGDWNYTFPVLAAGTFTIRATRAAGANAGEFIELTQDGGAGATNFTP